MGNLYLSTLRTFFAGNILMTITVLSICAVYTVAFRMLSTLQ